MSGALVFPNKPVSSNVDDKDIVSSAFWPVINPKKCREVMRMTDNTVTDSRLRHALVEAIVLVNDQLKAFRLKQQSLGLAKLEEVEAEFVDEESILVFRYRRAVYCFAKSEILKNYKDYDSTSAQSDGDKLETAGSLLTDANAAVADINGEPRVRCELI